MGARPRMPGRVSRQSVLAAVVELSEQDHAPSTTLIMRHLAADGPVTGAFQSAVHDALRHLQATGRVSRVTRRGTHRCSANDERDQPPT